MLIYFFLFRTTLNHAKWPNCFFSISASCIYTANEHDNPTTSCSAEKSQDTVHLSTTGWIGKSVQSGQLPWKHKNNYAFIGFGANRKAAWFQTAVFKGQKNLKHISCFHLNNLIWLISHLYQPDGYIYSYNRSMVHLGSYPWFHTMEALDS